MKGRSLLALPVLAFALSCDDARHPTDVQKFERAPSEVILDGAHGGNPDFWFLPPMVAAPFRHPDFELGKFNNALRPSLRIEICELRPEGPNGTGLPIATTRCKASASNPNVDAAPIKTFPAGTINLVNLPRRTHGWWSLFGLPDDGFYYVLWNTRQSNLNVNKFYRIKVLIEGSTVPLGVADVDPMSSLGQWRHSKTGHVVQMIDDFLLPIPFRVEQGALCSSEVHCTSVTVPNNNPNDDETVVTVDGGAGVIGGASFPDGWLRSGTQCPTGTPCPQSVVVTITEIPSGETEGSRTRTTPCHLGLPLQQFNKCFQFTTTPELPVIAGAQFALDVTVAVCYVLQDTEDPRAEFAQLYSSGPNQPTQSLPEVDDSGILGAGARNCTLGEIGFRSTDPVTQFATEGWRKVKGFFGVQTAYALDAGLGGLVKRFSNIGPALTATIEGYPAEEGEGPIQLSLDDGVAIGRAKIVGSHIHAGEEAGEEHGINNVPVTFSVASGNGTLRALNDEGGADPTAIVLTEFFNSQEEDGVATVEWTPPTVPGTYTMTASGPTTNGPIAFSVTVPPAVVAQRMVSMQTGATIQFLATPPDVIDSWLSSAPTKVEVSEVGRVTAIVGGENSNGGDGATLTSILTTEADGPSWLVNTPFTIYPRTTTLVWVPVQGAASYDVVVEHGNQCTGYANCEVWSLSNGANGISGSSSTFTFGFVGAQPGRWRVTARDVTGAIMGDPSPYIFFRYTI